VLENAESQAVPGLSLILSYRLYFHLRRVLRVPTTLTRDRGGTMYLTIYDADIPVTAHLPPWSPIVSSHAVAHFKPTTVLGQEGVASLPKPDSNHRFDADILTETALSTRRTDARAVWRSLRLIVIVESQRRCANNTPSRSRSPCYRGPSRYPLVAPGLDAKLPVKLRDSPVGPRSFGVRFLGN
jgi:hypothetical protein